MMKILPGAFLFGLLFFPAPAGAAPEIEPREAMEDESSAVKDRLASGLFFRGELADKIIEAGMAGSFVNLDGIETNAGARSALLAWIQKNPARAAQVYLSLKGAGGRLHDATETREVTWEINPDFLALIKSLNAAAGDSSVSAETLELASRRLYAGPPAGAGGPEVGTGGASAAAGGSGSGFFSINYADYRLDKAGLEREILQAGAWLKAARGSGERPEMEGAYWAVFSLYGEFVAAASALKGREVVTERESSRLEGLRGKLRTAMTALALRARVSALTDAAASLDKSGAEPGAKELLSSINAFRQALEASTARVESGGVTLRELGGVVNSAENYFAALYLRYSAYNGLLSLKSRAARSGFSCVYDYAVYRYLAAFFPETAYPRARAELAAAASALDVALLKAGEGDLSGALSGEAWRVESAAGIVRSASSFNRGAQFFLWGLFFRPVEYKISVRSGRAVFRPAFTFFEVLGRKRPSDGRRP